MADKASRFIDRVLRFKKKRPTKRERTRPRNLRRKRYRGQGRV